MNRKICEVAILPTKGGIRISKDTKKLLVLEDTELKLESWGVVHVGKPQHLYFICDDELKENDWFISDVPEPNEVLKCKGFGDYNSVYSDELSTHKMNCFKIVATTDESLGLPLIPQSFVEDYVEAKGEIGQVKIKMELTNHGYEKGKVDHEYKIETNSDNKVIIHK